MATKTQNRVKLTKSLTYKHLWLVAQADPSKNSWFPYDLLASRLPSGLVLPSITPNKEIDSHLMKKADKPFVVTGYSANDQANSFEYNGWRFLPITQDQEYHPPTPDVFGDLWDGLYAHHTVKGEKIGGLKYAHHGIAVPRYKYAEFPLDMLRYDRTLLFNAVDADLVRIRTSHRNMDDAAIERYAKHRGFDGIRIVKFTHLATNIWTEGRWNSFGWEIREPTKPFGWENA